MLYAEKNENNLLSIHDEKVVTIAYHQICEKSSTSLKSLFLYYELLHIRDVTTQSHNKEHNFKRNPIDHMHLLGN